MTSTVSTPSPAPAAPPRSEATLSQAALVWRRFRRHRIALACALFLPALYLLSLLAPFFAPHGQTWRDARFSYAPPMPPRWSPEDGLHVHAVRQDIDPVTLRRDYVTDSSIRLPVGFFVSGEPYTLFAVIRSSRHFIGLAREACIG